MTLQYASDLHLEFADNSRFLRDNPIVPVGEVLVLAGDIGYLGDDNYSKHPFWDWASDNFRQVIVVPGNHELYKYFDINRLVDGWILKIRDNITCHYNDVIHLDDDVDVIASTLWSKIELENAYAVEHSVSDFRRIFNGEELLDWTRFNAEHERCVDFIKRNVNSSTATHKVVVTHHVPSYQLVAPEFVGSKINGAFTAELADFIANSGIAFWIYGHSHRNINKTIGATQCVSNQLGYVFAGEHRTFDPARYLDLVSD